MNYNIEDIKLYMENFGTNDKGYFTEDDVDWFICEISQEAPNFNWETGATKLVIIPDEFDYVIKIPFNGEWRCGEIVPFYASQGYDSDDYCSAELEYYLEAKEHGFEDMFLPIEQVMEIDGIPIYVQAKATILDDEGEKVEYSSKDSRDKILDAYRKGERFFSKLPLSWTASCLDVLGDISKVREFMDFLYNTEISRDLHRRNVGYYNKKAVIIDYGGYFEDD